MKSEISDLKSLAESISRQLRAWADQLQNTPIRGQRYLNEGVRQADDRHKRLKAFGAELTRIVAASRRGSDGIIGPRSGDAAGFLTELLTCSDLID